MSLLPPAFKEPAFAPLGPPIRAPRVPVDTAALEVAEFEMYDASHEAPDAVYDWGTEKWAHADIAECWVSNGGRGGGKSQIADAIQGLRGTVSVDEAAEELVAETATGLNLLMMNADIHRWSQYRQWLNSPGAQANPR